MRSFHVWGGKVVFAAVVVFCAGCGVSSDGLGTAQPVDPDPARSVDPPDAAGVSPTPGTAPAGDPGDSGGGAPAPPPTGSGSPVGPLAPDAAAPPDAAPGPAGPPPPTMNPSSLDMAAPAPGMGAGPDAARPAPDMAPAAPPQSAPPAVVVRAMQIEVNVVRARVIYAKDVVADSGRIAMPNETPNENRWESSGADGNVMQAELVADTIYVKDLRCGHIEAEQVYAKRIVVGGN